MKLEGESRLDTLEREVRELKDIIDRMIQSKLIRMEICKSFRRELEELRTSHNKQANVKEVQDENESMKGGLWLTSMGRIVLDNHNYETYSEPYDQKLMTKDELTNGIKFTEFMSRIAKKTRRGE